MLFDPGGRMRARSGFKAGSISRESDIGTGGFSGAVKIVIWRRIFRVVVGGAFC
jgi:hypothetical protein